MSSSLKDFGDPFARFQRRDDEIGYERETRERRDMQDPVWKRRPHNDALDHDEVLAAEYDETLHHLIDFEESCIAGRGDLLHLVEKMIRRRK